MFTYSENWWDMKGIFGGLDFHNTMEWVLKNFITTDNGFSKIFQKMGYFLWVDFFAGKRYVTVRKTIFSGKICTGGMELWCG